VPKCLKTPPHPRGPKEAGSESPSAPSSAIPSIPSNAIDDSADHLTLVHVLAEALADSPDLAIQPTEQRSRKMIPPEPKLLDEPQVVVEIGPVAERILARN